ncbi:hypothetical protein lerEdw1_009191, partial [Lerista edwardsae]
NRTWLAFSFQQDRKEAELRLTLALESMEVAKPEPPKKKLTTFLTLLTLVTCMGSVVWGYNLWLVNDPVTRKQYFHNLTTQIVEKSRDTPMHPALFVFTVAAYLLGCLLGSLLFGPLGDKYGRKAALMVNDVFTIVSSVTLAVSKSFNAHGFYALARFLTGVSSGILSCAIPIYLGEISPTNLRGGITIVYIFFVSLGVMVCQVLGGREFLGNPKGFPFLQSIPGIISLLQLFLLLPFPESPRYLLIQKEDEQGARQALQKLRGQDDVENEMEELREEDQYEKEEKGMTILKLLFSPRQRWQVVCVVTLIATQQCSGVNAVRMISQALEDSASGQILMLTYYYGDKVFLAMMVNESTARYLSASGTFLLLFGQILSIYTIDSWGRRSLLLIGFGICIVSCILLTMSLELQDTIPWTTYVSSFLMFIFLTGFVLGPNSIPHLMIVELFLQSSRASAIAIGSFVQWFLILCLFLLYFLLEKPIGPYSFLICLPFTVAGFYYALKAAPETKKKTILDIRKLLEAFLARKYLNEKPKATKKPEQR